ncbi:MAG: hypothetical protein R3314_15295, partial [Longimicrobiales bacterium]|nr:hypothetical protein [Longimicrobiales bacterium]
TLEGGPGRAIKATVATLREYETIVAEARSTFNPLAPWQLLPTLARAQARLDRAAAELQAVGSAGGGAALQDVQFHLQAEVADLRAVILSAANVHLDVISDEATVVPGQTFRLEVSLWNGGIAPVRADAGPLLPPGWTAVPLDGRTLTAQPGRRSAAAWDVTVPTGADPSMPYYLDPRGPDPVDMYAWPDDTSVRGLPFAPPPVRGSFLVSLEGVGAPIPAELDAAHIAVDARDGQSREPVKVVPAVSLSAGPGLAVVRSGAVEPFEVAVRLRSQAPGGVRGTVTLDVPERWSAAPGRVPVSFDDQGAEESLTFRVRPPDDVRAGAYRVRAHLRTEADTFDLGYDVIDYPHIDPHHLFDPAVVRARVMDVRVADVRVGYVPGAGDGVPEALDQLGLTWETLDAGALAAGSFDRFDVIVTGIRAYEVNDALVANNQQLLGWVRDGGTLLVQYNKYPALDRDYTPWPVTIDRPHGRVTDETAPVRILELGHPVFNTPNEIRGSDWLHWVQERGLYFWETWPETLTPLL